jgi:hypothetical protein
MSHLKGLLDAGSLAVGIQLRFGSPGIAEMAGLAGFDWLLLDTEHAPQSPAGVQAQLQAIGCTKATPIVRLGHNDPAQIRLYLDMGAAGIVVAFIETAVDAKMGADACRYPPRGTRGWGWIAPRAMDWTLRGIRARPTTIFCFYPSSRQQRRSTISTASWPWMVSIHASWVPLICVTQWGFPFNSIIRIICRPSIGSARRP